MTDLTKKKVTALDPIADIDVTDDDLVVLYDEAVAGSKRWSVGQIKRLGVIPLPNITSLSSLNTAALVEGQQFYRGEFWPDTDVGAVNIKWDPNEPVANHNGGTIIDPAKISELNTTTKTFGTYFTPDTVSGNTGCFVVSSGETVSAAIYGALSSVNIAPVLVSSLSESSPLYIPINEYSLSSSASFSEGVDYAISAERHKVTLRRGISNSNFITFNNVKSLSLDGITLAKASSSSTDSGHCLALVDQSHATVENVNIREFGGVGTGIITYSSDGSAFTETTYQNLSFHGDRVNSSNTNAFLIAGGQYCQMSNLYADGVAEFAIEYKNEQRHSTISDVIVSNSKIGIGYGQDTSTFQDVSYCATVNYTIDGCDFGVVLGDAKHNGFANGVVNGDGHLGAASFGVRASGQSSGNAFWGVITVNAVDQPIRWDAQSSNNFAQIASHDNAGSIVTLETGATRNVTEISHPGIRNTIIGATALSGNPASGTQSNPYYCHATGEYMGTLSGRWRWSHDLTGTALTSSNQKWVFEGSGPNLLTLLGDTNSSVQGISVVSDVGAVSLVYVKSSDYWQGDFNIGGFRLFRSVWRSLEDNVTDLGSSSLRFKDAFIANGVTTTSDEREKEQIRCIDAAEKRVAAALKSNIKAFKWKDSVLKKGESARWHFGIIAQEVVRQFEAEGLDAHDYGMLCYDEWKDQEEILGEDGEIVQETVEAGNRYGVRYDELIAFILAAL